MTDIRVGANVIPQTQPGEVWEVIDVVDGIAKCNRVVGSERQEQHFPVYQLTLYVPQPKPHPSVREKYQRMLGQASDYSSRVYRPRS